MCAWVTHDSPRSELIAPPCAGANTYPDPRRPQCSVTPPYALLECLTAALQQSFEHHLHPLRLFDPCLDVGQFAPSHRLPPRRGGGGPVEPGHQRPHLGQREASVL